MARRCGEWSRWAAGHAHAWPAQELTLREHARCWSALLLRPGATLAVAHVGVADSALLATNRKDMGAVLDEATAADLPLKFKVRGSCRRLQIPVRH